MRYSIICVLSIMAMLTMFVLCKTAWAGEAQVEKFTVGKATVWAIADSTGERDMNIFPDADPQVISRYVPSGRAPTAVMVFLVKIEDEMILIDTGLGAPSGDRASRLGDGLKQIGVTPEQITMVLITHMHLDHIGGLLRLDRSDEKAFPSARVLSSRIEHEFWFDEKSLELFPERRAGFETAQRIFSLYGPASETFEFDAIVVPGIQALDGRGHSPGHTLFLLESDGERLLFLGDTLHQAELQFPRPDINARFDMNPEEAATARLRILEMATEEKLPIAGAHLPFPGIGTVERRPEGGFIYTSR